MITEQNISEWAEHYLRRELNRQQLAQLNHALDSDPALYRHWKQTLDILRTFETGAERTAMRSLIADVAQNPDTWKEEESTESKTVVMPFRKYLRTTAAAAGLILVSSLATTFFLNKNGEQKNQQKFIELGREVARIKHSQSKIIDSLNKNKPADPPAAQDNETESYGGTCFALSNDGYFATNYHVVKEAGNIYVQTPKGDQKAYIVARDIQADVAILKVEDKGFKLGKGSLPYSIAKANSSLGQKVFTLGYPKDEVVYNEGYISSEAGYEGDRNSYQLEMTANPGQSGSPVLDKYGAVIGIVTGKQSNTTGTTFAVHADALYKLVRSLPETRSIRLPETNKLSKLDRTEQVKRLRSFVFSVRVN
ncbi:MAG: serine protease [Edaphocola sp.]